MKTVITMATLDREVGRATCELAAETAGLPCEIVVAHDEFGEGGTKTANRAWREALTLDPDYLCYVNDDVEPRQRGWLRRLISVLENGPKIGIAAPGGVCGTVPQKNAKPGMPEGVQIVKRLSFFVTVVKRAVLDEIGLLDESFRHFGCDGDYCHRAQEAGWKCVWVRDVYVQHNATPLKARPLHVRRWKQEDATLFFQIWSPEGQRRKAWQPRF